MYVNLESAISKFLNKGGVIEDCGSTKKQGKAYEIKKSYDELEPHEFTTHAIMAEAKRIYKESENFVYCPISSSEYNKLSGIIRYALGMNREFVRDEDSGALDNLSKPVYNKIRLTDKQVWLLMNILMGYESNLGTDRNLEFYFELLERCKELKTVQ
jgi:hypothetical protein